MKPIAKFGLAAKGTVYCLIGLLAFMSAFNLGGQTTKKSSNEGVFLFVMDKPAGKIILGIITLGLLCYAVWRFIQTLLDTEQKGKKAKGLSKRLTYFFSGITYLFLSWVSFKVLSGNGGNSGGSSKTDMVSLILHQPAGQWLLGLVAAVMAGIGVYQIWYGNSEKFHKHVNVQALNPEAAHLLMRAGKIGYISRGIVWLVIAFLFFKAALHSKASEAGDTSSAFAFVEQSTFGTYLLAALAIGLICYGVMNFIRAGFEKFKY
ncbi:MAG: DUF1206 domain-containing protein [Sphingobacteriaceae bacterium]|nr:DUF1206 domain-containing protein [Sphingobacteriaceae bacterium]